MNETYMYREHSIDLVLKRTQSARTVWTYFIDKYYCVEGATDSLPLEAARASVLALAHRSIDTLESMQNSGGNGRLARPVSGLRRGDPAARERLQP